MMTARMTKLLAIAAMAAGLALTAPEAEGKTFRFAFQGDVQSMDPYAINETMTTGFLAHIYEPLVLRNADLELEPALATSWTRVSDTTWRFALRRGVTFHGGEPFTADDVIFSFERVRRDGSDLLARVATIAAVRKVDDFTVEFDTNGPDPTLLANLSNVYIMSRAWAERNNAVNPANVARRIESGATTAANGTGPFRLRERQPGLRTVLTANASWWGTPRHNLTEVIFQPIANDGTRVAALISGEMDMVFPLPLQDIARIERTQGVRVLEGLDLRTIFFGLDMAKPELPGSNIRGRNPLSDVRVRRALMHAIDADVIRDRLMRGRSTPTALLNGPGIVGFDAAMNRRLPFDIEASRRLLREAGYPEGFEMGLHCSNNRYVNDEPICQAIAAMFARVGVKVNLTTMPFARYFAFIATREANMYMLGTTPPTYDAFSTVFGLLMCRQDVVGDRWPTIRGQGQFNHGGYCNRDLDNAVNRARVEMDPAARQRHFSEVWRIMQEDVAVLPLHQQALAWGTRANITLKQRPDDVLDLRHVRVD